MCYRALCQRKLSGHNTAVKVGKTETIKGVEPSQVYKYLGVDESNGIQHSTMRERLRREYFRRVKMDRVVWSEQGSSHQRVGTTGSHVQFWRHSLEDHGPAAA